MKFFIKALLLSMVVTALSFCAHAAENVLLNPAFESYDSETRIPDNWMYFKGRQLTVDTDFTKDGNGSLHIFGGYAHRHEDDWPPVVTEAPSSTSGSVVQVIDLSTSLGWGSTYWLEVKNRIFYSIRNSGNTSIQVEFLPKSYNGVENITADDPVWKSDAVITNGKTFCYQGYSNPFDWHDWGATFIIPTVRWARMVVTVDATFKINYSNYTDGEIYAAIDKVSLTAEPYVFSFSPPDPGNLLLNGDFEEFDSTTGVPDHWHVLQGKVAAVNPDRKNPASGDWFVGHPGGALDAPPQEITDMVNSLVQVVDLANIPRWADAETIKFGMGGIAMRDNPSSNYKFIAVIEYLPAEFNDTEIAWDSDAWENSSIAPVTWNQGRSLWSEFKVPELPLIKVRWMRIRLDIDSSYLPGEDPQTPVTGGFFDRMSFTAKAVVNESLVENAGFEITDQNGASGWYSPDTEKAKSVAGRDFVCEGEYSLGLDPDNGGGRSRVYQVLDLKDHIPFWMGGIGKNGYLIEYPAVSYSVSAMVANLGGKKVSIGIDRLPYSYNKTEHVSWDDPAWEKSQWVSDGSTFTNSGGDGIDSGEPIKEIRSEGWHLVARNGWLPKTRWVRLKIEFEADPEGSNELVAIDNVSFTARCELGPYSCFGPELGYPEAPDVMDKAVPGWIGPEGVGVCGGYTGKSKRNYVNPAFAGFADDYQNYITSGQNIGMSGYDIKGDNITGPPFTDAGWVGVIVTTGDMDLSMLADYFGPSPSGNFRPGEITAVFNDAPITNGAGPDFACFENGFVEGWSSPKVWAELSYVEVSSNGVDFARFPTHSLTPQMAGSYFSLVPQGLFGFVGKHVNAYGISYGTPFDLDWIADHALVLNGTVDLDNIKYVKMVDIPGGGPQDAKNGIVSVFKDSFGSPVFDAWVTWGTGGSDLDAVGVLNTTTPDTDGDGISDPWDNCPNTPNPRQFNTNKKTGSDDEDGDTYGNACDCDLNQDDVVDAGDYAIFRNAWGGYGPVRIQGAPGEADEWEPSSSNWNPDVDFNGDFKVNGRDFQILKKRWGQAAPFK